MDWRQWHQSYDDPDSALARRLEVVQTYVRAALDRAPAGAVPVVSLCAGQGRDLLGVLEDHPRAADVHARLVELDPELAATARTRAASSAGPVRR
jgi:hypothetical protein